MSEISKYDSLPTTRVVVIVGLHQLRLSIDNLVAIKHVRKDLAPALEPIINKFVAGMDALSADIEKLETEYLAKEEDCLEYATRIVELNAALVTEKAAVADRDKELSAELETSADLRQSLEAKNVHLADVVRMKNRAEITVEELTEERGRLERMLQALRVERDDQQHNARKMFDSQKINLKYIEILIEALRKRKIKIPAVPA